jgi:segregation and condensation protein A
MYKYISGELKDRQMDASRVLFKAPTIPEEVSAYEEPVNLDELVADLSLQKLNEIFRSMMKKQEDKIDPIRSKFGKIQKEEISLEDCMASLQDYARVHNRFSFRGLLAHAKSKTEVIVTFLAILELMKMGAIHITQEEIFDDIQITSQIAA